MTRSQRFTLVAAILGSSVAAIDGTIVNVALPAIQADLGGDLQTQQWIANAYVLTLASLILIGGSLGDIYGRRRVFALGVGSFGVLSIACAVAPSTETLIAARALQGVAGALLTPSSLAIIAAAFSERGPGGGVLLPLHGIASAINNAIARVAGLVGISAIGAFAASRLPGGTFAPNPESVDAFHAAIVVCAALVATGGVVAAVGIQNPRRRVRAEECAGGQLVGAPRPAAVEQR